MKLGPGRWRILMQGDDRTFGLFPWNRRGLDYLLTRLFSGEEIAPGALDHYGIAVRPLDEEEEVILVPGEAEQDAG
jgi:hypothetical protein